MERCGISSFLVLATHLLIAGLLVSPATCHSCYPFTDSASCADNSCKWQGDKCVDKPCWEFTTIDECGAEALEDHCIWILDDETCNFYKGLSTIKDSASPWDGSTAMKLIQQDLQTFVQTYYARRDELKAILSDFLITRQQQNGILKIARWGKAAGVLLENLPETAVAGFKDNLINIGREAADMLISAHMKNHSFVEDTVMRGWPMFRRSYTKYAVHEASNFGHIGQAVALAAKAAALAGDHELAVKLITPVLEHIYDNFIDSDKRKKKVDPKGRLVLVPKNAPADRLQRYLEVGDFSICLDKPDKWNHGTSAARAAMEAKQVLDLINWRNESVVWPLSEITREICYWRLNTFVRKIAHWMNDAFKAQRPFPRTGAEPELDNYPGPEGTKWYTWKYQDISKCEDDRAPYWDETGARDGEFVDRAEDLEHGKEEMLFLHEFLLWDSWYAKDIFHTETDLQRLMVTFLNRLVHNYTAKSEDDRFACDVDGNIDGMTCERGGRDILSRSKLAVNWLMLAHAAQIHGIMERSKQATCDAYRMVQTVLPLATSGPWSETFDSVNFAALSEIWAAEAIIAKYHFYNYDYGVSKYCNDDEK